MTTSDTGGMKTQNKLLFACILAAVGSAGLAQARDAAVVKHMHEHYDAVLEIQGAVIAGKLEGTREPARYLAEHEAPAGMPAEWGEHVEAMRTAANAALEAQDIASAATATANLGLSCGGCHIANGITVEFDDVERPSDDEKAKSHMQRHQWAADRMWEGLIGPADVSWSRGGNMLFESPMRPNAVKHKGPDDDWKGMARRIHQLAANSTTVRDLEKKGEIYAEFLGNCAACHNKLDKGPGR